jgi:hypothetical protein
VRVGIDYRFEIGLAQFAKADITKRSTPPATPPLRPFDASVPCSGKTTATEISVSYSVSSSFMEKRGLEFTLNPLYGLIKEHDRVFHYYIYDPARYIILYTATYMFKNYILRSSRVLHV